MLLKNAPTTLSVYHFYQTNTCRYSVAEIFQVNKVNPVIEILPDLSSKIECFGKINGVDKAGEIIKAVSYTHLTLPTNREL